jgi:methylated-DNA-protein-cysteine methyltransferase-like protein
LDDTFSAINDVVRSIPPGRVMSYGMVADLAGATARVVGWAMSSVADGVPWHRVVGADGHLRIGRRSPELQALQRSLLHEEGVYFSALNTVDMERSRFGTADGDSLLPPAHGTSGQ